MSGKANTACLYTISSCQISTLENEAGSVGWLFEEAYCTAHQCSPLRRKFMECYIIKPAQSFLMKHLVIFDGKSGQQIL